MTNQNSSDKLSILNQLDLLMRKYPSEDILSIAIELASNQNTNAQLAFSYTDYEDKIRLELDRLAKAPSHKKRGMTTEKLAKISGVSERWIYRFRSGGAICFVKTRALGEVLGIQGFIPVPPKMSLETEDAHSLA